VAVNRLRFQDPIVCWFNAWHHDDAPTIVPALASAVARAAAGQRNRWRRILDPLPSRMLTPKGRRKRHFITVLLSLVVAAIALLLAGAFHSLTTADHVTIPIVVALATAGARELSAVRGTAADLGSLVRTPGAAFASGSLDEVRGDLGRLIHQATQRGRNRRPPREHRRLFVYIDDLERCQPERSIEVCETVSGLLSHEDVVVVLIGDMQTLATAAEVKYKDLAPRYRTGTLAGSPDAPLGSFGELYLEKIIQFRFDLPTHNATALKALVSRLLAAAAASVPGGPVKRGARSVVESERRWLVRQLSRAWHPILDFRQARARRREDNRVKAALLTGVPPSGPDVGASQAQGVNRAEQQFDLQMLLRRIEGADLDESYDAVADRVRPLPRDLKRLLNRIRFLLYLTTDRGLMQPAGPLAAGAIGKWALLAERWPDLAVTISANPDILTGLESASATDAGFVAAMADIVPGYARSAELRRLLVTPPALGSVAECLSRLAAQPAT
jgi:hypothetical protein